MTDRAVSTTLNYVLGLSIAMIMITGLLIAGTEFVADRNEEVSRSEMQVIGQRVAEDVQQADRLVVAGAGGSTDVEIRTTIPSYVSGSNYVVELDERGSPARQYVSVRSFDTDETVSVRVATETNVRVGASVNGGALVVSYTGSELVIRNG